MVMLDPGVHRQFLQCIVCSMLEFVDLSCCVYVVVPHRREVVQFESKCHLIIWD